MVIARYITKKIEIQLTLLRLGSFERAHQKKKNKKKIKSLR